MNKKELNYLENIINEEIFKYLSKGYPLTNDYIITLRSILKQLNLMETFDYDIRFKENTNGKD